MFKALVGAFFVPEYIKLYTWALFYCAYPQHDVAFVAHDDCMEKIMDYSEDSIPVLSQDGHMLGVITSEDIVEMVDNEMGEDYAKLAGLTA